MTFMVVDTDSYDVLLGLDFLIKIGAIVDVERRLIQTIETQEDTASSSNSDTCTNSNEHGEEGSSPERRVDYEDEFGEGELEKLVESEGPPEILQLILQEQADDFMNEKISEGDVS
ncbi:unnamed protein product [Sphagnum tenellum]